MKYIRQAIFLLFITLLLACSSGKEEKDESQVATVLPAEENEVKVKRLEYADFQHELIANGTVTAQNRADLRFQTSEKIAVIYVKNGDRVAKGQKIAELDPFRLRNSLAQAKDNLERSWLELQDVLIGQGYSIGDTARVPAEVMQLARTRSNYEQTSVQFELAEYNYKNSVLYAPFAGVVANLFTRVHNLPSASEPFCTVIDNRRPEVDFRVLESELPYLRTGDKVQISPYSVNDYSSEGRVTEINPVVDPNGMVRVRASVDNGQDRLFDGMNVKIRLQRPMGRQLVIPKEALVLRNNRKVVFVLDDTRARWAYVETGSENSTGYVITEGLEEGDMVIYEGNINLAHESPVTVVW